MSEADETGAAGFGEDVVEDAAPGDDEVAEAGDGLSPLPEDVGEVLLAESGSGWWPIAIGPLLVGAVLTMEALGPGQIHWPVVMIFLIVITGPVYLFITAARKYASVELTEKTLRCGTRRINLSDIGTIYPPNNGGEYKDWEKAPALGELPAEAAQAFQVEYRNATVFGVEKAGVLQSVQGPIHPVLGIAMDMSIQLKAANGAICTLSLSFNNDGPLGTYFRYIGDTATYLARYDDLFTGKEEKIDVSQVAVSMNGIELQDREFFSAIKEGREPNASVGRVFACYQVLDQLEKQLNASA